MLLWLLPQQCYTSISFISLCCKGTTTQFVPGDYPGRPCHTESELPRTRECTCRDPDLAMFEKKKFLVLKNVPWSGMDKREREIREVPSRKMHMVLPFLVSWYHHRDNNYYYFTPRWWFWNASLVYQMIPGPWRVSYHTFKMDVCVICPSPILMSMQGWWIDSDERSRFSLFIFISPLISPLDLDLARQWCDVLWWVRGKWSWQWYVGLKPSSMSIKREVVLAAPPSHRQVEIHWYNVSTLGREWTHQAQMIIIIFLDVTEW